MHKLSEKVMGWIPPQEIEVEALRQAINVASLPFIFHHVAIMPDCHWGKGATVGSVIPTIGAIVPAAVGVDIGCGMIAVKTPFKKSDLPDDLEEMRLGIERRIPCIGRMPVYNSKIQDTAAGRVAALEEMAERTGATPDKFDKNWRLQLGTLGGGNHFIEITLDEEDNVWAFLHSGSRGVGNKIACHFIKVAQKLCKSRFISLPDNDLAYLVESDPEFRAYITNMIWAQRFAYLNREEMMARTLTQLSYSLGVQDWEELQRINCHHNFTQKERHFGKDVWLTRKGAISAREGELGLIPGSMGTSSYVVEGKGCRPAFSSAPHGAGRRFSRRKARESFTMEDFDKAMEGISVRRDESLLDEIPGAYKDIDHVMENAEELVTIKHTFRQVLNVKGD